MNRVFRVEKMFPIPDDTLIAPVLNAWDVNERTLPISAFPGASMAVGEIRAGSASKVHLAPLVSQVAWVLHGTVRIRMKGPNDARSYTLEVEQAQGVLTEPLTFLQFINPDPVAAAQVLYIVAPAYVYEGGSGYDDARVFDQSWEELERLGFPLESVGDVAAIADARRSAMERIRESKAR